VARIATSSGVLLSPSAELAPNPLFADPSPAFMSPASSQRPWYHERTTLRESAFGRTISTSGRYTTVLLI
jgi:hypothetical protein